MTGLYVDPSALLKRIFAEAESQVVRALLRERASAGGLLASSELTWVEVARAALRGGVADVAEAVDLACSGIAPQPLSGIVLARARIAGLPTLRTLDAIHLAAALELGVPEMLTFDHRLADAARYAGVKVIP